VVILQRQEKRIAVEPRRLLFLKRGKRLAVGRQHGLARRLEPSERPRE
jgi:hypothetical protein